MNRIFDIAQKDILQLTRDFKTFMFLIIMPIIFTFLFGFAFGGFGGGSDSRLPVVYVDQDGSWVSTALHDQLAASDVIRLEDAGIRSQAELKKQVADGKLAAIIIVPERYGQDAKKNKTTRLTVIADSGTSAWTTTEAEILSAASRIDGALSVATILEQIDSERMPYRYAFKQTLAAWDEPPIGITETVSPAIQKVNEQTEALAHTSPGMMLQFSIASLLTVATVIVNERKSRALQRMLTTATQRVHILLGHYLAIFIMIFTQFTFLIIFAQVLLKIDYLRVPLGTGLVALCAALCIAALGLLIGVFAKSEEQAVIFSLIPMFVFAGLGGAWVPLEVTGEAFRTIGHVSPISWAMDGFKNITLRGLGIQSTLLPAAALLGYAIIFFGLATWRFRRVSE